MSHPRLNLNTGGSYEQYRRLFGQVIKFHEREYTQEDETDDFLSGLDADAFMQQFDDEGKDDIL